MAYVSVPKDLTRVKSKVLFNLTKRQLLCFGVALLLGVPLFFLLRGGTGTSAAVLVMILAMLPGFLLALYEKHGQPLEVIAEQMIQALFVRPKERPYHTYNLYAALMRQNLMEQEVKAIVQNGKAAKRKKKADTQPAAGN